MVRTCGFYDANEDYLLFLALNSKEDNLELHNKYYAMYYQVYSKLEEYGLRNSLLKMAYIHLHNALDEFLLELIQISLLINLKCKKKLSENEYEKDWKKQSQNNSEHRLIYFSKEGFIILQDWKDDIILFSKIRNALIHNNSIINELAITNLQKTIYKNKFKEGAIVELSIDDLEKWIVIVSSIRKQLFLNFNSVYNEYIIKGYISYILSNFPLS